jgi:hypothetical protein
MTTDDAMASEEWIRYGRALIAAMREVLDEVDDRQHELLLETADFWLRLGLVIGLERRQDAERLLSVLEGGLGERRETLSDAEELLAEALP